VLAYHAMRDKSRPEFVLCDVQTARLAKASYLALATRAAAGLWVPSACFLAGQRLLC